MLSLVADYETTSSSSTSSEENVTEADEELKLEKNISSSVTVKPTSMQLLPSANLLLRGGASKPAGDVFSNSFLEAEKLEIDKLQKHVKMVDSEDHLVQKNGLKICWNNRKGRCRFGNKCKYAHDSDLVVAREISDVNKQNLTKEMKTPAVTKSFFDFDGHQTTDIDTINNYKNRLQNRKRPALGDNVVPGKRVMKTYQNSKKST